jgi:Uma2 family endonuclease
MIATLRPLTYEDLQEMPDDGQRYEVVGGELIVNPAPRREHQEVVANLDWNLQTFLRQSGAGRAYTHPVDVHLGRHDVVQPDLIVIGAAHLDIYRVEGVVEEAPDLIVEVISPSSRRIDRIQKMALYARSGVPEYWIADPERRLLEIHVLAGEEYRLVEPASDGLLDLRALPGLSVDPDEAFAGLE